MTSGSALCDVLDNWNSLLISKIKTPEEIFDALKEILQKEPHLVKEVNRWRATPLHHVIQNRELSTLSIVNLMLSYGANVNCINRSHMSPLHLALFLNRGEDVIRALLEKFANVNAFRYIGGQSLLCFALEHTGSANITQLLLDAGCSTTKCRYHGGCALRCATQRRNITINEEVIRLLIEMNVDLNSIDEEGRSPLCYVLENGVELWVIDLLVAAGGSINACTRHASPLHCATRVGGNYVHVPSLGADVIGKLLELMKKDDPMQLPDPAPLQSALCYSRSKKEAIKVLFDHLQGSRTIVDECGNTLLHLAALNKSGKPSVVEFLIESGVEVDSVNDKGETPLHLAVIYPGSNIAKILLKAGSSVNAINARGENPLQQTVNRMGCIFTKNIDILKVLFIAGSRIGNATVRGFISRVRYNEFDKTHFNYCNMLLKCHFLENPNNHILHLIQDHPDYTALSSFVADCKHELHKMRSTIVGKGRTLRDLLDDRSSRRVVEYDFSQLEIISDHDFPLYFDIIASKIIGRLKIEEKLREVHVRTPKCISGHKEMVALNYNVVCSIADRLTDEDLLRFILAFRKMDCNMCTSRASNENALKGKRVGEQSERSPKRPKLQI